MLQHSGSYLKLVFFFFLLIVTGGNSLSQNSPNVSFFPGDSLNAYCVRLLGSARITGTWYHDTSFAFTYAVPDTIIDGEKYYLYDFDKPGLNSGYKFWLSIDDSVEKKVYRYYDGNKILFADFNVSNNQKVVLNGVEYTALVDEVFLAGKNRKRVSFRNSYSSVYGYGSNSRTFVEGYGLYSIYSESFVTQMMTFDSKSIFSAIFDSSDTKITPAIDSISHIHDRYSFEFPYEMKVYSDINNRNVFQDSFYVEYNIVRDGSLLSSSKLEVNDTSVAYIPFDGSYFKTDDIINFRVIFKSKNIFMNDVTYPGNGYISFRIKAPYETVFPGDTLNAYCVKIITDSSTAGGEYRDSSFINVYSVPDTVIDNIKYYLYNFGGSNATHQYWLSVDDPFEKKTYRYFKGRKQLFTDFNVSDKQSVVLNMIGYPVEYTAAVDSVFFSGTYRKRFIFTNSYNSISGSNSTSFCFIMGFGLYSYESVSSFSQTNFLGSRSIYSALFNSTAYNKTSIDSVSDIRDRFLYEFPYNIQVYGSYPFGRELLDSFYIDYNILRDGTLSPSSQLEVDSNYTAVIPSGLYLKNNDIINFRVVYKERSIFNDIYYPEEGYISFRIKEVSIDSTSDMQDRYIYQFPYEMQVFGYFSNKELRDTFYVEYKILRDGTLILSSEMEVDSNNIAFIPFDSSYFKFNDNVNFRVVYKDKTIPDNIFYPDEGYISFRIKSEYENLIYSDKLYENYPNPFNKSTMIKYSVRGNEKVSLKVYNILGNEVAVLINEEKTAGEYVYRFNASDFNLASGIYFCRLIAGSNISTIKMVMIK